MRILVLLILPLIFLAGCTQPTETSETTTEKVQNTSTERIIFWGEGCSHCVTVEEYLNENDPDNILGIERLEVFSNKDNQNVYLEKSEECNREVKSISVPMMFWEGKCYSGDKPIIDLLKDK